jgi:DNA gyrase/topoisomerase IV subunit B
VNAADNFQKDGKMSKINVNIDESNGTTTVLNDGKSIPVQVHK